MNVLTRLSGFVTRNKTTTHATHCVMEPSVDHTEPPRKPPPIMTFGSYCFRARTTLVPNDQPSKELHEFMGYAERMDIVDKVNHYCELTRSDDPGRLCTPATLTFLGRVEACDGRVVMHDKVNDVSHVFF